MSQSLRRRIRAFLATRLLPHLFQWLGRLPLATLHRAGALAGRLAFHLSGRYRERLTTNMGLALGRPPKATELACAAREAGRMLFELPWLWQRPLPAVLGRVFDVRGWEHVEAARAAGRAIIGLTPHLGCFEITSLVFGERHPATVMYRPPKLAALDPLMRAGRARGGVTLVPADLSGVRSLMRSLKRGEAIGLLPDQAPGTGEGIWAPFFGRPAYTMTLAARLSAMPGTEVLILWGERFAGRGWRLHIERPAVPIEGSLEERTAALNRAIECTILRCPTQYLWGYNRYKRPAGAEPPPEPAAT